MIMDNFPAYHEICHLSADGVGNGNAGAPFSFATWKALDSFAPGCTGLLAAGAYAGDHDLKISGNPNGKIILQGDGVVILDGSIFSKQDYVIIKHLVVTDRDFINRMSAFTGSAPPDIPLREGWRAEAGHGELVDVTIHDTRMGALIDYKVAPGCIVEGAKFLYNGWIGPDRGHGHGLYAANASDEMLIVRNCVLYGNFGYGLHLFADAVPATYTDVLKNILVENCIVLGNNVGGHNSQAIIGGSGYGTTVRNLTVRNSVFVTNEANYCLTVGYLTAGSVGAVLEGNLFIGGTMRFLTYGGERVAGNKFYCDTELFTSADYPDNTYGNQPTAGLDCKLMPNGYLFVANWGQAETVQVDVSSLFADGTMVNAANIQSFDPSTDAFADVQILTVENGQLTIDMQAEHRAPGAPQGWVPLENVFPKFGVFILEQRIVL